MSEKELVNFFSIWENERKSVRIFSLMFQAKVIAAKSNHGKVWQVLQFRMLAALLRTSKLSPSPLALANTPDRHINTSVIISFHLRSSAWPIGTLFSLPSPH